MNVFQDTLRRIADRVEGTQAVALIGMDGIPIDSWGSAPGLSMESITAELGAFLKSARGTQTSLASAIQQLAIVTDRTVAILSRVTEEYYLLLVLGRDGNFGRGRFELKKAAMTLENELL